MSSPGDQNEEDTSVAQEDESATTADEADPSGIEVAANPNQDDDMPAIVLGDRWHFTTTRYGDVIGIVYFNDGETEIRIMPDGLSTQLIALPLEDDDFAPDLGVIGTPKRLHKGPAVGFVALQGYRVDQILLSFTAKGQPGPKFKVTAVNEKDDRIEVEDTTGARRTLDFNEIGINEADFQILLIEPQDQEEESFTPEQLLEEQARQMRAQLQGADIAEALGEEAEEDDFLDIELPPTIQIAAMQQSQIIYDEIQQKGELLSDLLSMLDTISQQNPLYVKRSRALVEMASALKNSVVSRAVDGAPDGEIDPSVHTLNDVLQKKTVPIARPVLAAKRTLMYENTQGDPDTDPVETDQTIVQHLGTTVEDSDEQLANLFGLPVGEAGIGTPRWFMALQQYFTQYPLGDKFVGSGFTFDMDGEFFRHAVPNTGLTNGLQEVEAKEHTLQKAELISNIQSIAQSYRRAHGPTYRPLARGGYETAIPADHATVKGHLLFPYSTVSNGQLGAIRSSSLWQDIMRSASIKTWMEQLIQSLGGVETTPDAKKVVYMDTTDAVKTNVEFADFLKVIVDQLVIRGPGDVNAVKKHLGIDDTEPDLAQQKVIHERVQQVLASLRTALHDMAEEANKTVIKPTLRPVLPESQFTQRTMDLLKSEKTLDILFKTFASLSPGYKQIDVAIMAYFLKAAQDYFLAMLSGNAQALERERLRMTRRQLRDVLSNALATQKLLLEKGAPPIRNPCHHVSALNQIRRVSDDTQRMALLAKFVRRYAPGRADNWMTCGVCQQHLICHHEILQIQQFLNPREHDILQREIILNYAGGTFGAKHICRNCGLPIAELGFDTSLEYDDEGRPMMGREVLVDKDALEDENLRVMLGVPVEVPQEIEFETPLKTECYQVLRVLCDLLGVHFDGPTIRKVVDRAEASSVSFFVDADEYKASGNQQRLPYQRYNAMEKIALMAALTLIEIQTHVPNYVIRYTVEGCVPGFRGFPIQEDAAPESTEQSVGINYIACALTGVVRTGFPWEHGFQTIAKQDSRKKNIVKFMINFLQQLAGTTVVQEELDAKRAYEREMFGAAAARGRPSEQIPNGFLPQIKETTEANTDAAKEPTVPEGAANSPHAQVLLANAWIRSANKYAKQTADVIVGNPFAETSCCYSPLADPGKFWKEQTMPPMPQRHKVKRSTERHSVLYGLPFIPRPLQPFNATPSEKDYFRVFLKLCYRGSRTGLPHEIGHNNTCDWCGIRLPNTYLYPDVNKQGDPIINEEEIQVSFGQQGIKINTETFQALLDVAHIRTIWSRYIAPIPRTPQAVIDDIGVLERPPVTHWMDRIHQVETNMRRLSEAELRTPVEIARALEPLSEPLGKKQDVISSVLEDRSAMERLRQITDLPTQFVFEVMRAYFLVPAQQILRQTSAKVVVGGYYKLSKTHKKEVEVILETHRNYLTTFVEPLYETHTVDDEEMYINGLAQNKLQNFVDALAEVLAKSEELRVTRVKFSRVEGQVANNQNVTQPSIPLEAIDKFLREIVRVLVYGLLGNLLDADVPSYDAEGAEEELPEGNSHILLRDFVKFMLDKYSKERLAFNPAEIRLKIEAAKEAEKQRFISDLDKLTEEERRVELLKKRYGIGRWSIGGTKLVWQYDKDQWDKNREDLQRNYMAASGAGDGNVPNPGGPMFDDNGIPIDTAGQGEGYDVRQHADEDEE
jgi:hypothetical protein